VGNFVHFILHESIETTLDLKERQKLELKDRNKLFNFGLIPDFEFGYINIFGRDISNTQRAEKQLGKMTLERNRSESEVKLAKLIQEEFFQEYPQTFRSMNFMIILFSLICRGSFYDLIELNSNRLVIVLGDV
jgi:hypothetical protein